MREILFRGKCCTTGEWVEGFLGIEVPDDYVIQQFSFDEYFASECIDQYSVKLETVGQYTGLTDKNGRKIFEGDIVNYNGSIHKVVFENRCYNARFGIVVEEEETWSFGMSVPPYLMEVIGNIHDNPELLKGE